MRRVIVLFAAGFLLYGCNNAFMTIVPMLVLNRGGSLVEAGMQGTVCIVLAIGLRFLFGPLSDRCGLKPMMAIGAAAFAVSGPLLALCSTFLQVLIVRCVQAVGLAAYFPAATAAVVATAAAQRAGFALGLYRLVSSASLMVMPAVALAVARASGFDACLWLLGASAAVAFALVVVLRVPGSGRSAKREGRGGGLRLSALGERRIMGAVLGATFLAALGYGMLGTYAAPYASALFPDMPVGVFFALMGAGGLVSSPLAGWASDRMRRGGLLAALLACQGTGMALLAGASAGFWTVPLSGFLCGFGYFGSVTCLLSIVAAHVRGERRASALSLQQNGVDLGIACASGALGIVLSGAGDAGILFALGGVLMAACGLFGWSMWRVGIRS